MRKPLPVFLLLCAFGFAVPCHSPAAVVQPVSVADPSLAAASNEGAGDSSVPLMTPDARFILFASAASNLPLAPTGAVVRASFPARLNVFLRDRTQDTNALVSIDLAGTGSGDGDSLPMGISTNGRYALFESGAGNLVTNDTNGETDVFVRDMQTGATLLVSVGTNGTAGNGASRSAGITPDGRFVAFVSTASDLVADDTNGMADVFVRDLQLGKTILASPGALAEKIYRSSSEAPEISDDGRRVAFYSTATNLVDGVVSTGEIYVRDLVDGTTVLASADARTILLAVTGSTNAVSYDHALSADGKFVAYAVSPASNPYSGLILRYEVDSRKTDVVHTNVLMFAGSRQDALTLDISPDGRFLAFLANTASGWNTVPCVMAWDAQTGVSTVVSRDLTNGIASGDFAWPTVTGDGRFVCFVSTAQNLVTNQVSPGAHAYVRDLMLNETSLVDADASGVGFGVAPLAIPRLSQDAQQVAFQGVRSGGAGGPFGSYQVFVRNRSTGVTELVSAWRPDLVPVTGNARSYAVPSVSRDGRCIAFASFASNLVPNDTNANPDVFVRDLRSGTTLLASVGTNGFPANGMSSEPSISADGRFVAFTSMARDLIPQDTNATADVFVFDTQTRAVTLGSVAASGGIGNGSSRAPRFSVDGNGLFFRSRATNLASGSYSSGSENLFWRDLKTGTNIALTTTGVGSEAVSMGGRYIAYWASNTSSLYIWDSLTRARISTNGFSSMTILAVSPDANRVAFYSSGLSILQRSTKQSRLIAAMSSSFRAGVKFSADGNSLVYASSSAQVSADTNKTTDVYLYDFPSATNILISRAFGLPNAADGPSFAPDISSDGRFVAYKSVAANIVPGDNNGVADIFIYDRASGESRMLSLNESCLPPDANSFPPVFSGDGRTLVFPSWASDLTAGDPNQAADLFAFTFLYAAISQNPGQTPVISWPATPGQNYQVQFKTHMDEPAWQTLAGSVVITNGTAVMHDSSAGSDQRIYRVVGF